MFKNICTMDQIQHSSGFLFVIKAALNDELAVAHPKYDLRQQPAVRISNPVDPMRQNKFVIDHAIPFGKKDYLIFARDVIRIYRSFSSVPQLKVGSTVSQKTRTAALSLIEEMECFLNSGSVGIAGSLATGNGVDYYSDIDLVMRPNDYKALLRSDFWDSCAQLNLRTYGEWVDFYHHYGVVSALTADEFASAAVCKRQQFTFAGIPVSIFVISDTNSVLSLLDSCEENSSREIVQAEGQVLYQNMDMLPGYGIININGKAHLVINFHRSYQSTLKENEYCRIAAYCCGDNGPLWVEYDSVCTIQIQ